jgi:hypothetical protein
VKIPLAEDFMICNYKQMEAAQSVWTERRALIWPVLMAGTITWCSGFAVVNVKITAFAPDKVGHFAIYGMLATAVVRLPALARWPVLGAWWAIAITSAYGLGDEFRQSFTIMRMFEWADWLADSLGAGLAVGLYLGWARYRRLLETPLKFKQNQPKTGATVRK